MPFGPFKRLLSASLVATTLAPTAQACDLALVLAVDVSGSVDPQEFRIQMDGLAEALRDGIVSEALLEQEAMVTLVQWTGSTRQRQTLPWTHVTSFDVLDDFADAVGQDPRVWRNFSTAVGEAKQMSAALFDDVPQCRRRVIDISGDGPSNEGPPPEGVKPKMRSAAITVNALAIETDEEDLTAYFFENVISGEGAFVETADGFEAYPAAILRKLQRETTKSLSFHDNTARRRLASR